MVAKAPPPPPPGALAARERLYAPQKEGVGAALNLAFGAGVSDLPLDMEALLARLV